jgi:thioredoxin-related protein
MKKILILTLLITSLFGASQEFANKHNYFTDYQQALKKAKQTNKPIIMMISTKTCPWCRKLESQTLRKLEVNNYIQQNYIPLSVIEEKSIYPKKFLSPAVPIIYFVNSDEEIIGKIVGYKPADKFLAKLKDTSYSLKPIIKTSPYSLENLKEFHVKFFDKSKILSDAQKDTIKQKLKNQFEAIGVNTNPKEYSNLVIKVESVELDSAKVLNITLRVIEDVIPKRDTQLEAIGITYYKNDLFELDEEPFEMIEESIFKYLIPEFLKQYKEEN